MTSHPLDKAAWNALTGPHRELGAVYGKAARYPADVSPIAAVAELTNDALADLTQLVSVGEVVGIGSLNEPAQIDSPHWVVERQGQGIQMLCTNPMPVDASSIEIVELGANDAADMMALAHLTEPGPFLPRTYMTGRYFGIRIDGQLAAMAGQRLSLDEYVEISAVCTHPDHRRKGYASILSSHVMHVIMKDGKTPFLHSRADNVNAIHAYEKLGFTHVRDTAFNLIKRV